MNSIRYLDAENVRPVSGVERQLQRIIPLIISKSMSELNPHADSIRALSV